MSQIVDTITAQEFMKETLERIDEQSLVLVAQGLAVKSDLFQKAFAENKLDNLTESQLLKIFGIIFSVRRKSRKIIREIGFETLKSEIKLLLYSDDPIQQRFSRFCNLLTCLDEHLRYDLTGEILHYTLPNKYWLWCNWMWNPKTKTGSLPLVTTEDYVLDAPDLGSAYMKVGKAVAFVHNVGEAAGFQTISRNLFGTDVYLSCVYIIYAYTVLRMRMTQEFNQVMPGVGEFAKRILGTYKLMQEQNITKNKVAQIVN